MVATTEAILRTLCQDPAGASEILSTADYTSIIAIESTVYRAAALACRTIASTFAQKVSTSADVVKIELQQKFEHYMELAKTYDIRAREGGGGDVATPVITGISIEEMDANRDDEDRVKSKIEMSFMDYEIVSENQNDLTSNQ